MLPLHAHCYIIAQPSDTQASSPTLHVQVTVERYGHPATDLDNQWVVPYNPTALLLFNCHINVEVTASISSVKYLTMYLDKGPDMIEVSTTISSSKQTPGCNT